MVGKKKPPELSIGDAVAFLSAVRQTFHDEPAKYDEFLNLLSDYRAQRLNLASLVARVGELLKDHWNLLLDFSVFIPKAEAKVKIPPGAALENKKRKRAEADGVNFMDKLKTRFQSINPQVFVTFLEIMKMYLEGKKSVKEAHDEVVALLQGHDDLVMEFRDFLDGHTD